MGNYEQGEVWIQWKFLYKEAGYAVKRWTTGHFTINRGKLVH